MLRHLGDDLRHSRCEFLGIGDVQKLVGAVCIGLGSQDATHHHLGFGKACAEEFHQRNRATLADIAHRGLKVRQAGVIERKASAVQKLADAQMKTAQSMMPFPAPPEQFVNGMPQQMPPQQPQMPQMPHMQQGMPPGGIDPMQGAGGMQNPMQGFNDIAQMGPSGMPPVMPNMPPVIPGGQR